MLKYIIRRIFAMIPTFIGITLVTFLVMQLAPRDTMSMGTGGAFQKESVSSRQAFMKYYGFDKPVLVRYGIWLKKFFLFDFGNSTVTGRPVMQVIGEKLPVTIYLNLMSIFVILIISIPLGVLAASQRERWPDYAIGGFLYALYSLFTPWVAIFLMNIFAVKLNILPLYGITSSYYDQLTVFGKAFDILWHTILPVAVMSYGGLAFYSRLARASVLEVLNQEYIVTARAKGLPESIVMRKHALANALIPFVTIFGAILPSLIGGSVIIENIFNIDGIGKLFYFSVMNRDDFMNMGLVTLSGILTLIGLLISDVLYAVVDPRIRLE